MRASLSLIAIALAGCGGVGTASHLHDSVRLFNHDIRWQSWETAEAFCMPAVRRELADRHRRFGDDFFVADFDIARTVMSRDEESARVTVVLSWYRLSDSVLRRSVLDQRWERHGGAWLLAEERSGGGDRI